MQINIVLYSIPYNKLIWNRSAWLIFLPDGLGGLRHVLLQLSLLCFIVNTDFVQLNYDCNFVCVCKPMVWQFVWGPRDILAAKAFSSAVSIIIVIHGDFHTIFICISVWWIFFHCHLQNISSILVDQIILELSNMKYLSVHHFKYLLVKCRSGLIGCDDLSGRLNIICPKTCPVDP